MLEIKAVIRLKKTALLVQAAIISLMLASFSYAHPDHSKQQDQNSTKQGMMHGHHSGMMSGQRDMWNPHWMKRGMWGHGMMGPMERQRMERHWTFMHSGIPNEYRGLINPIPSSIKSLKEGASLYKQQCASCHGVDGLGDGEAGKDLTPSPALLAYMIQMPMAVDEYMMWSISEGGKQFGTAMPGFKEQLTRDEIWKIVSFMRAGFPENAK